MVYDPVNNKVVCGVSTNILYRVNVNTRATVGQITMPTNITARFISYHPTADNGAGGSADLPGMTASHTILPVIGVPVKSKSLDGLDSLLSIVQMPAGVQVATVAINGSKNAGILAAEIIANNNKNIQTKLLEYKERIKQESLEKNKKLMKKN